jgi:aspartyl-tRNA(Asn)/glutamyl-tRNA(Gln) amidotransferase subunit A
MNFKNLTISQIKNYFNEGGDIEKFYRDYFKWLKEENKKIQGFLLFTENLAWQTIKALKANSQPKTSNQQPLWGIPIAIKDCIMVKGEKCTAGSKILENYIAPYHATVIKKLINAGAVIVGKTNMDEFAMGSSTENSAFFPTFNPHDKTRVPGGSSGGSSAVVGAGLAPIALGSDTGGSIRQPAGFCGVYGLKPSYGAVSRYGLIAMASSLDQIGVLARNLDDVKLVYDIIKGKDEKDSTSVKTSNQQPTTSNQIIGLPKEFFEGLDKKIKNLILSAVKKTGLKTKEISITSLPYSLGCYYLIMPAEVSANLARFDGIRYGKSQRENGKSFWDIYLKSRKEGLGKEAQRRIILGTFILSHGYYEAYYNKAQKLRKKIFDDFQKAFKQVDLIVSPVSPTLPFKLAEKTNDPLQMYLADIYTVPVNLAYLPGLTIPAGFIDKLPVGLQIIGNLFEEQKLLEFAELFQ